MNTEKVIHCTAHTEFLHIIRHMLKEYISKRQILATIAFQQLCEDICWAKFISSRYCICAALAGKQVWAKQQEEINFVKQICSPKLLKSDLEIDIDPLNMNQSIRKALFVAFLYMVRDTEMHCSLTKWSFRTF